MEQQNIIITCPSLSVYGGIRIILEWANRLSEVYKVSLLVQSKERNCTWFKINHRVKVIHSYRPTDILIVTSPHGVEYLQYKAGKKFLFCQMAEHLFRPTNEAWKKRCIDFYKAPFPMFISARWNIELFESIGRQHPTIWIGNGVNLDHFHLSNHPKDFKTVLIEGWEARNPAKDIDYIAPRVAKKLKEEGYSIIAYGAKPLTTFADVPDEYYRVPELEKLNELYERATILIKASKYDARALAPMEAMTKGTPTARAIILGDDDLIDNENCLKVRYDENQLYNAAKKLLTDKKLHKMLSENCFQYVQENGWDRWMPIIIKNLIL